MAEVNPKEKSLKMEWPPYDVGEEPDVSRDDDGSYTYTYDDAQEGVALADYTGIFTPHREMIVGSPGVPSFPRSGDGRVFVPAHRRGRSMVKAFWRKVGGRRYEPVESRPVEVFPEQFHAFAQDFIMQSPMGPFMPDFEVEDYKTMRTFVSDEGMAGGALRRNGDHIEIMALFNMGEPGGGSRMLDHLVSLGANRARVIGEGLRDFYEQHGFGVANEEPWIDYHAPSGWDYDAFGRPNTYVMEKRR